MPAFPRSEMEEMMRRWLKANEDAETAGDWRGLADHYTEETKNKQPALRVTGKRMHRGQNPGTNQKSAKQT